MPTLAPRICGCGHKIAAGAMCLCQQRRKAAVEKSRPSARQRGYSKEWERESAAFLARPENRFCACGCSQRANMVDHKVAHKGDMRLFWDHRNWQPMNRRCNSRKAASREGGFGNPIRAGMALP
jgi:5-methylcytosine-specific restriction endonuclease McrA